MDKERKGKDPRACRTRRPTASSRGRNAVIEALRAGTTIDKIFIQKGETDKTLGHIASTARAAAWSSWTRTSASSTSCPARTPIRGVIALTSVREYVSVEDILNIAREKGENPLDRRLRRDLRPA